VSQGRDVRVHLGASGYRAVAKVGAHRLVADEPVGVGGTDTGPTPVEMLGAALGSCIAITVRMVAERKGWPLEGMDVRVARSAVPVEGGRPRTRFDVAVALVGPLDAAMRAELGRIAGRCPVHRLLEAGSEIVTTVVD
jgi:putative redox protein